MATKSTAQVQKKGFLSKTRFYLFEYTALQVCLALMGASLAMVIYTLFSIITHGYTGLDLDWLSWVFGLLVIFSPLTISLYARTTAEEISNPGRLKQPLRHVAFYMTLTVAVVSLVGFAIAMVYSTSRAIFGVSEMKSLVSVSLPSLIVVAINLYLIKFLIRADQCSNSMRRANLIFLMVISAMLIISMPVLSLTVGAGTKYDKAALRDLSETEKSVSDYFKSTNNLPSSMQDLTSLDSKIKAKFASGEYSYSINNVSVDNSLESSRDDTIYVSKYTVRDFKLCANFKGATYYRGYGYPYRSIIDPDSTHPKGYYCFNLSAY
jgi:competence protein ComGC